MKEEKKDEKKELAGEEFEFNPLTEEFEYSPGPVVDMEEVEKHQKEKEEKEPPKFDYIPQSKKDEVFISEDARDGKAEKEEPKNLDEMFEKDPKKALEEIDKKMRFFKDQSSKKEQ